MDVVMEDSASTCVSRMRIHDDGISLQLATDRARELDQECISRSGLLNDLVNNSHPSEEMLINVSEEAMRLWLGQVLIALAIEDEITFNELRMTMDHWYRGKTLLTQARFAEPTARYWCSRSRQAARRSLHSGVYIR